MATDEEIQSKVCISVSYVCYLHVKFIHQFGEYAVQCRTKEIYEYHCKYNTGPLASHFATTYGILRNSILNQCNFFHITDGLVPDIMHIILEGSLELCTRHMLIQLIHEEKAFTLDTLNNRISSFNYGQSEMKNKPSSLLPKHIAKDGHLKQSGKHKMNLQ